MPALDARKCDYPLDAVARRPRSSRPTTAAAQAPLQYGVEEPADLPVLAAWRAALEAHVTLMMQQFRVRPDLLRVFVLIPYLQQTASLGSSSDDEEDGTDQGDNSAKALLRPPPTRAKSASQALRRVYLRLHALACTMGTTLYTQVHRIVRKSLTQHVLSREAYDVRLLSMFKLELRRQITLETLLEVVMAKDAARTKREERRKSVALLTPAAAPAATLTRKSSAPAGGLWQADALPSAVKSAYEFKMHALERLLLAIDHVRPAEPARRPSASAALAAAALISRKRLQQQAAGGSSGSSRRLVSEQMEELIHEKVTAFLYSSKNRDNFPYWKDPPESTWTREETARHVRSVLAMLTLMPLLQTLTLDQLLEVLRVAKWKTMTRGDRVCEQQASMEELFVVAQGRVGPTQVLAVPKLVRKRSKSIAAGRIADGEGTGGDQVPSDDEDSGDDEDGPQRLLFDGEMSVLNVNENWKSSLYVQSSVAKLLIWTRPAFDTALHKLFGGIKSKPLTSVSGANTTATSQRPSSSPSHDARSPSTSARPSTAAAKDKQLAAFRQLRDAGMDELQAKRQEANDKDPPSLTLPTAPKEERSEYSSAGKSNPVAPTESRRPKRASNFFQYYPSFDTPGDDGNRAMGHAFRLKWMLPIAFEMESLETLVEREWAPSFPETSAMIGFLSSPATSLPLLFGNTQVLLKEILRPVCFQHPFYGSSTPGASHQILRSGDAGRNPMQDQAAGAGGLSAVFGSPPVSSFSIRGSSDDGMSLSQFTDARKKMYGRGSSLRDSLGLNSYPNASHGAQQGPFTLSSFVSEANFFPAGRVRTKRPDTSMRTGIGEEDPASEDGDEDKGIVDLIDEPDENSRLEEQTQAEQPPHTGSNSSDHRTDPTRARKMALDSVLNAMSGNSPQKLKAVENEKAKQLLIQKHVQDVNATSAPETGSKQSAARAASPIDTAGKDSSQAPLPLRIDLQRRMELVLAGLKMKPKAKLDLVLKYTHADHYDRFESAVGLWEQTLRWVLKRETALANLRAFELVASDPRRHFRSLSIHRLSEQKKRDNLFHKLNNATELCREAILVLDKQCGDHVYFGERLYREKMAKDYTELLYEVEQERLRMIYAQVDPVAPGSEPALSGVRKAPSRPSPRVDPPAAVSASCAAVTPSPRWSSRLVGLYHSAAASEESRPSSSNNSEDQQRDRLRPPIVIPCATAMKPHARNQLSTRNESIFVSVLDGHASSKNPNPG